MEKPPLGLLPKDVYMKVRFTDICNAICRYWNANQKIPIEWIEEYNDLIEKGYSTDMKSYITGTLRFCPDCKVWVTVKPYNNKINPPVMVCEACGQFVK